MHQHARRHCTTIAAHWHDLTAAAVPGTTRRRHTAPIGAVLAAAIRERDRVERAERSTLARGATRAPAELSAVQVALDVEKAVLYVEHETRSALGLATWPRPAGHPLTVPSACSDLAVLIRLCDHDQAAWIAEQLAPAARAVLRALDLDERPLRLTEPCPWCGGPLEVHAVHDQLGPHVVCNGDQPCEATASTWLWGRPLWRFEHLDQLGDALATAHAAA